ncbi:MAG: hypothetical protein JWN36_633 [Microbacteriaceae bacterium]|jgi:uncharacterized Tic20 family protein|nr:hypothetical protein [Microbacteriaceae bacterium]
MTEPTPAPQPVAPFTEAEDKQYSTLATFLNIIPLIPALIFYFAFGNRGTMIKTQSKENLNWTINVTGIVIADWILSAIFGLIPIVGVILGILLFLVYLAVLILNLIFSIIGGIKNNTGELYRYPVNIRWIK